jgi:hypothetical protein
MTDTKEKRRIRLHALDELIHDLSHTLFDNYRPYRPEKHYMRGPGPKWHAKYGLSADKDEHQAGTVRVHI